MSTLGKRMGLNVKGKGNAIDDEKESVHGPAVESEDEEESRGRIGKKRKVDKVDMFAGKKKAKAKSKVEPIAPAPGPAPPVTQPPSIDIETSSAEPKETITDVSHPSTAIVPVPTTDTETAQRVPALAGLNKNQRKKLRKKQKKMAQVDT